VEWTVLLLLLFRPFRCRERSARHLAFFFRRRRPKIAPAEIPETAEQ
jgi:hypothetical protein